MLEFILISLLGLTLFGYVGYPFLCVILGFFTRAEVKKDESYFPSVSLLIAAYNEESFIEQKIRNSLELDYPRELLKIIVVSDGSTDRTDEIVRSLSHLGVELFRVEGRVGKTQARNVAVAADQSEVIVFSDATAIYSKNAIKALVRNLADPSVGMVSGNLKYVDQGGSDIGLATKFYWSYETFIKRAQSRLLTLTGAIGCINAFKRSLYTPLPSHIIEDFTEPLAIIANGHRVVFESEAIAFERTTQKGEQEFKMRVRVIRGGMTGALFAFKQLGLSRRIVASIQLISHKVIRWLAPLFLSLILLFSVVGVLMGSSLAMILLFLQVIFYFMAWLSLRGKVKGRWGKVCALPGYFVVVNGASLKALYLTLTSELAPTWETNIY